MTATPSRSDCRGLLESHRVAVERWAQAVDAQAAVALGYTCVACGLRLSDARGLLSDYCQDCQSAIRRGAAVVAGSAVAMAVVGAFLLWWWFR